MYYLTPKFVRFKLHKEEANSSRRARTFRHQLISAEIDRQQKSLKVLRRSVSYFKSILFQQISWVTQIYVSKFLKKQAKDDREKFSVIHKRKLQNLGRHISSDELDVVVNLSHKKLTPTEHQALNHGLQFGILPTKFNFIDVQTEFENLYWQVRPRLQNTKRLLFKTKLINLYNKYQYTYFYSKQHGNIGIALEEMEALNSLKKDKSIIVCKADKGNAVVLLNKLDYINKMKSVLSDTKRFKQVNYENIRNLDKFQKCLYYLKQKGSLKQEIYDRIRPSAAITPTLYGLPKIHKEDRSCRPVLASTDCYTYECASWLSEILSPQRQHPTNLKDTFEFVEQMQQVKFKNNSIMVPFDVKSLFTNIPVDFVTDIILKEIYGSDSTKKVYGMTKRQFRNLLVWTTKRTTLNFNGSFYEQIDGVGMGSPIAPAFADIFMNYVIEKTKKFNGQRDVFFRYVDDCRAVFPDFESAMLFYRRLNQIHKTAKFTYELENNKQLPFLDVNVDNSKEKLEQSDCRKPAHTGLYNKWSSLAPTEYKVNLIRSLVNRAIKICSNRQLLFLECEKITKMLQQNGYPTKTIRNVIRKA